MVLYEKNADEKRYPASTTKIMTALLTLENVKDLNETVTAEQGDFTKVTSDSSNADIKVGETVRVIDLLYALMLPSANEAAYILARHVGGTSEHFVDMMTPASRSLAAPERISATHAACTKKTTTPPPVICTSLPARP